jgi:hypothetical protein
MGTAVTYYSSSLGDDALDSIKQQGFALPVKPAQDRPELPDDLSDLDDESLTQLMKEFTAWGDYASAQVGLAVITERECEMELELITADVWQKTLKVEPKTSVTVLKTVALTVESVAKARRTYEDAYAYRRLISDVADRFEKDALVLSRELTRRTQMEFGARTRRRDKWEA